MDVILTPPSNHHLEEKSPLFQEFRGILNLF